jgi:hypothetical protein
MFDIGQSVQLAEHLQASHIAARGTVVGFDVIEGDVIVRWDGGFEAALAPSSLTAAKPA